MRNSFLHLVLCWSESATSKVLNSFPWLDLECSTTSAALNKSNWTQQTKKWNHTARKHFYISAYLLFRPDWFDKRMKMMKPWHWTTSFTCCMAILHITYNYSVSMNFRTWKPPSSAQIKKTQYSWYFITSVLCFSTSDIMPYTEGASCWFCRATAPNWTPLLLTSGWNLSHPNWTASPPDCSETIFETTT